MAAAFIFGAPHDDVESNDIIVAESKDSTRYLMHPVSGGYHWSKESIVAMQKFVRDDLRKCLRNKPVAGKPYKKILPGRIMSRDEQCKKLTGFEAYTGTRSEFYNCKRLVCVEYQENRVLYHKAPGPPAEGSDCNYGGICLDGECVQNPDPSQKKLSPPKPLTRDEQCKKFTGYRAYSGGNKKYTRDCKVLTCVKKTSADKVTYIFAGEPPMEGTECGFGEICQDEKCILNPEILKGKIPPPKIKTREEQCQKLDPTYHSYQDSNEITQETRSCLELTCEEKNGTKTFIVTAGEPPEDGTECGPEQICFADTCVQYSKVFSSHPNSNKLKVK